MYTHLLMLTHEATVLGGLRGAIMYLCVCVCICLSNPRPQCLPVLPWDSFGASGTSSTVTFASCAGISFRAACHDRRHTSWNGNDENNNMGQSERFWTDQDFFFSRGCSESRHEFRNLPWHLLSLFSRLPSSFIIVCFMCRPLAF